MKVGDKFNRLTAIAKEEGRRWLFLCDCGVQKSILAYHVTGGRTQSCGCLHKEVVSKQSLVGTKEYVAWQNMKARAKRPTSRQKTYEEKGIQYPTEWENFENFLLDVGAMPDYNQKWSLERIDNEKSYSKENCCWSLPNEQARNRCMPRNNTSGHTGVSYRLEEGKYLVVRARVKYMEKEYCKRFPVNRYASLEAAIELAVAWRQEKLKEFGFSDTHGNKLTKVKE